MKFNFLKHQEEQPGGKEYIDAVTLAHLQFGTTIVYHYLFIPLKAGVFRSPLAIEALAAFFPGVHVFGHLSLRHARQWVFLSSDKVDASRYTYWWKGKGGSRKGGVAPCLPAPRCSNEENVRFLKRA